MESRKSDWERVGREKLGEGGQSEVYLVRTPERTDERARSLHFLESHAPPSMIVTTAENRTPKTIEFVEAIRDYTRPDLLSELGAMKEFKLRVKSRNSLFTGVTS